MAWCFSIHDGVFAVIDLVDNSMKQNVQEVCEATSIFTIKIKFADGDHTFKNLRDFKPRNEISQEFRDCLNSRSSFVKQFEEIMTRLTLVHDSAAEGSIQNADTCITDEPETRINYHPLAAENNLNSHGVTRTVHIENLVAPSISRRVRPLKQKHVNDLMTKFEQRKSQGKLFLGLLTKGRLEDVGLEGMVEIETIGGNHSRAALQNLYQDGKWGSPFVLCTVFKGLSDEEVLQKGMTHNIIDQDACEMTFIQKTRVIRRIKKTGHRWSSTAKEIFGFKTTKEALTKLRTMSAVADLPEDIWESLCNIDSKWTEKKTLKQTAFTNFVTLDEETQTSLIKTWEEEGFSSYLDSLKKEVEKKKGRNEECSTIQDNLHKQNRALKDENIKLKGENDRLKNLLAEKDRLISNLKRRQVQTAPILDDLNLSTREQQQETEHDRPRKRKKDDSNVDPKSVNGEITRMIGEQLSEPEFEDGSVEAAAQEIEFREGDCVWALYAPDNVSYPAKILNFNIQQNKYRVEFEEDGIIVAVKRADIKRRIPEKVTKKTKRQSGK